MRGVADASKSQEISGFLVALLVDGHRNGCLDCRSFRGLAGVTGDRAGPNFFTSWGRR
jgi:hypothetical protein